MIDFYKIADTISNIETPVEEDHIQSFSLEEFRELSEMTSFLKSEGITFHFF